MTGPRKAVFLHTQKTAGTSIVEMARVAYGLHNVVSHADYVQRGLDECLSVPFVSGHFGYGFAKPIMDGRYSFTFLRDPIDRLISLYSFCRSRRPEEYPIYEAAQRLSLENFLLLAEEPSARSNLSEWQDHRETVWNHQTWQLAQGWGCHLVGNPRKRITEFSSDELLRLAIKNVKKFDYIGFTETFDEDCINILTDIGIPPPEKILKSNASQTKLHRDDIPRSTMALLQDFTRLDQKLYDAAWSRRTPRILRLCRQGWRSLMYPRN